MCSGSQMMALLRLVGSRQMQFGFPGTFVLCFHQHKVVGPWSCFMTWFVHTNFEHLVDLLLEGFFKMYWYGSAGCLLWCNR